MSSEASVSHWLEQLKAGDKDAVRLLWDRYFERLMRSALARLPRRPEDAEDVALSAFNNFCARARAGRYPSLADRDELWRILVVYTAYKANHLLRDEGRQKRGGGRRYSSGNPGDLGEEALLEQLRSREPSPEFAAQSEESATYLLDKLPSEELRSIAIWRMAEFTVEEIAARLDCSERTVERKIAVIRDRWRAEGAPL